MTTVLIIGKTGQVALSLRDTLPSHLNAHFLGRDQLDLTHLEAIAPCVRSHQPAVVINATAYTAVDKAESDCDMAFQVNALAVAELALICAADGIRLLHISTDFVFGPDSALGPGGIAPLLPDAKIDPMGVYGASKRAGEAAIADTQGLQALVVRTAWVYSEHGHNFVKTMLKLMASKPSLGVISDQIGTPTWARGLAQWLWVMVDNPHASGFYHWTDAGVASWYDFAVAIQELALARGLLKAAIPIDPLTSAQYPTPAKRPGYSVLDKSRASLESGLKPVHWRTQLAAMLDVLASANPHP